MRALSASLSVAALFLGAACGFGATASYDQSHSARQIVNDASASTGAAKSFHMTLAETTTDGKAVADLDVEGTNVSGKVTAQGISVRLVHAGDQTFAYGADVATFLAPTNPQAAALIKARAADKWILMPPDFWNTSFSDIIDMRKMSNCLKAASGLVKKGTATISGRQAVEVDDQLSSKMYVETAAPHHFLRVVMTGVETCVTDTTAADQTIDLSRFGARFNIAAPSGYVDLASLG